MNKNRLLALPAISAAALLSLTGCFQIPTAQAPVQSSDNGNSDNGNSDNGDSDNGNSNEGDDQGGESDLAGTSWSGQLANTDVEFTLNEDGTIDFDSWNGTPFDAPEDVWTSDGDTIDMTISNVNMGDGDQGDVNVSGTVSGGSMQLSGTTSGGSSIDGSFTQN